MSTWLQGKIEWDDASIAQFSPNTSAGTTTPVATTAPTFSASPIDTSNMDKGPTLAPAKLPHASLMYPHFVVLVRKSPWMESGNLVVWTHSEKGASGMLGATYAYQPFQRGNMDQVFAILPNGAIHSARNGKSIGTQCLEKIPSLGPLAYNIKPSCAPTPAGLDFAFFVVPVA